MSRLPLPGVSPTRPLLEAWELLERLPQEEAQVPALWLWEVGNVLIQAERRRRITPAASSEFLRLLETLPIRLEPPASGQVWHDTLNLARSHQLTAYDAAYLELAMRQGLAIASRDQALIRAAQAVGVLHLST